MIMTPRHYRFGHDFTLLRVMGKETTMKRSLLFAAVFTLLIASAAPAAEDKNVAIVFHFTATSPDFTAFVGSYTITGAISESGKWRLTGGTGAYADIKGHGTASVVGDIPAGTVSGAYQGKVNVE